MGEFIVRLAKLTFLLSMLITTSAHAANAWVDTKIVSILVHDNGTEGYAELAYVRMSSNMAESERPTCVTNSAYHSQFVVDFSRPVAQAQYSMLLSANLANKKVTVQVNQICAEGVAVIRNVNISE